MRIAVDFDGTIVLHEFPRIGSPVPFAFHWLRRWKEAGATLILWTVRNGTTLNEAVRFLLDKQGFVFDAVNEFPGDAAWSGSPKVYANLYVDDAAFGCPLVQAVPRSFVDWRIVGPEVMKMILKDRLENGKRDN